MGREKGTVKWFSTEKGYGFIRRDRGGEIFVHHTDIEVEGYASLRNGETVEFEVFESDRGPKARKLIPLEPVPAAGGAEGKNEAGSDRRRSGGKRAGARDRARGRRDGERRDVGSLADQLRSRLAGRFPGLAE